MQSYITLHILHSQLKEPQTHATILFVDFCLRLLIRIHNIFQQISWKQQFHFHLLWNAAQSSDIAVR